MELNRSFLDLMPFPKVREARMAPGCHFYVMNDMLKQLL